MIINTELILIGKKYMPIKMQHPLQRGIFGNALEFLGLWDQTSGIFWFPHLAEDIRGSHTRLVLLRFAKRCKVEGCDPALRHVPIFELFSCAHCLMNPGSTSVIIWHTAEATDTSGSRASSVRAEGRRHPGTGFYHEPDLPCGGIHENQLADPRI